MLTQSCFGLDDIKLTTVMDIEPKRISDHLFQLTFVIATIMAAKDVEYEKKLNSTSTLKKIEYLIKSIPSQEIDSYCNGLFTALGYAVTDKDPYKKELNFFIIHKLLLAGANVNLALATNFRPDKFHDSALTEALERKDLKLVKLLMQFGAKKLTSQRQDGLLFKQIFNEDETKIYKQAKYELICAKTFVILGAKDKNSWFSHLPEKFLIEILTCDDLKHKPISYYQGQPRSDNFYFGSSFKTEALCRNSPLLYGAG